MTELQNSNFDNSKTQLGQNSKTQIVTKLNINLLQNSNSNKTQLNSNITKLKGQHNIKAQIVIN